MRSFFAVTIKLLIVLLLVVLLLAVIILSFPKQTLIFRKAISEEELVELLVSKYTDFDHVAEKLYAEPNFWENMDLRRTDNWTLDTKNVSYSSYFTQTEWEQVLTFIKQTKVIGITYYTYFGTIRNLPNLRFTFLSEDSTNQAMVYFHLYYIPITMDNTVTQNHIRTVIDSKGWQILYISGDRWYLVKC